MSSGSGRGFVCHFNTTLAEKMMRTHVGQLALREGVGISVWIGAWRDGRSDFTERDVARWKQSRRETVDRLAGLSVNPNKFADRLLSTFAAMQDREKELYEKYCNTTSQHSMNSNQP